MKIATFIHAGRQSWGTVRDNSVVDLGGEAGVFPTLKAAIAANALGKLAAEGHGEHIPLADVTLMPVIPDPSKIVCVGLNYDEHRRESHNPELSYPTLFVRWADSLIGNGAAVVHPHETTMLDWEGELAVIVGRGGTRIARADAWDHVSGYAAFNDISVRDWQKHTTQMTPGKNFPTTGPLGPWMVTRDEVPNVAAMRIQTRLNGAVVQDASAGEMIFDIPRLIEYISSFTTLNPGDLIMTGTPGGVGFRRQPQMFMKPGDWIEVEITGIGTLTNEIVAAA